MGKRGDSWIRDDLEGYQTWKLGSDTLGTRGLLVASERGRNICNWII